MVRITTVARRVGQVVPAYQPQPHPGGGRASVEGRPQPDLGLVDVVCRSLVSLRIAWLRFDHYTSRPTVEVPRIDRNTWEAYTQLVSLRVAGDPQLHTHVAIPNDVLTDEDRIGDLDLQRLDGRIKEFGAVYQAYLADWD